MLNRIRAIDELPLQASWRAADAVAGLSARACKGSLSPGPFLGNQELMTGSRSGPEEETNMSDQGFTHDAPVMPGSVEMPTAGALGDGQSEQYSQLGLLAEAGTFDPTFIQSDPGMCSPGYTLAGGDHYLLNAAEQPDFGGGGLIQGTTGAETTQGIDNDAHSGVHPMLGHQDSVASSPLFGSHHYGQASPMDHVGSTDYQRDMAMLQQAGLLVGHEGQSFNGPQVETGQLPGQPDISQQSEVRAADSSDSAGRQEPEVRFGTWEKWPSGTMYEKAPDGSYTGNYGT